MRAYLFEKYPCGYEKEIELITFLSLIGVTNDDKGCPLHGKNCPPSRRRR